MDVADFLKAAWPYAIVAAPGLWAVWKQWNDGHKGRSKERVDLVKLAEEVSAKAIVRLQEQIEKIEREFGEFRKRHDDMIEAKDARIARLEQLLAMQEGETRKWRATAESYERILTEKNIDHIPPEATVWQMKGSKFLLASGPTPETEL